MMIENQNHVPCFWPPLRFSHCLKYKQISYDPINIVNNKYLFLLMTVFTYRLNV